MPSVRTLLVILVVAMVVTIAFAFTLIGMLGEAIAALVPTVHATDAVIEPHGWRRLLDGV